MRAWPLLALLALACAAPAAAQDGDIWDDDPYAAQDETVIAVDRVMDVLLDLPMGQLAGAMPNVEIEVDIREDSTLRDIMVRNDPNAEE